MKNDNLFNIKNKVVVITGAAGLLGEKHAEIVAQYGGIPILLDLSLYKVKKLSQKINQKYKAKSFAYKVDITNEMQIIKNSSLIFKKFGKIDCLINNAANNPKIEENHNNKFTRLENMRFEQWKKDIDVGLTGSFLCSKHYGNLISLNINGGSIINISSDLGLIAPDQRLYINKNIKEDINQQVKPISYSVVKSGLIGLTRYLATYWPDKNVRCNAICPGGIENGQQTEFINKISLRIPMGRLANVNDFKTTLIWMICDASNYLNGAIVPVDGGRTTW